jgi:hypothetical protein
MDDITPLRQLAPAVLAADAHLFTLRPAYRFRPITAPSTTYDDPTVGENPRYGASINYYLEAPVSTPPTITILNQQGEVVRTLAGTNTAGINRIHWDLRDEPTTEVTLRTSPIYAPHIVPGPNGRTAPGTGRLSILAPPGTYTVKLSVDGTEHTQPLTVLRDPNSGGTEADIAAQTDMLVVLRRDMEAGADAVHRIESVRVQLDSLSRAVEDDSIKSAAATLQQQLMDLEMNLVDLRLTGGGQDGVRFGSKLLSKLNYLAAGLAGGDFKPTSQQAEVQQILAEQLRGHVAQLDGLLAKNLKAFNEMLRARNIPNIIARAPK